MPNQVSSSQIPRYALASLVLSSFGQPFLPKGLGHIGINCVSQSSPLSRRVRGCRDPALFIKRAGFRYDKMSKDELHFRSLKLSAFTVIVPLGGRRAISLNIFGFYEVPPTAGFGWMLCEVDCLDAFSYSSNRDSINFLTEIISFVL